MEGEQIAIVDKKNNLIGYESKLKCHTGAGILHKAIQVYLFNNKKELLLTKRSVKKLLWPGFWDASSSTHILKGENYEKAADRRILQELGIKTESKKLFTFTYHALYEDIGAEREICALLVAQINGQLNIDANEVSEHRWISLDELQKDIIENSNIYCPWLKISLERYLAEV